MTEVLLLVVVTTLGWSSIPFFVYRAGRFADEPPPQIGNGVVHHAADVPRGRPVPSLVLEWTEIQPGHGSWKDRNAAAKTRGNAIGIAVGMIVSVLGFVIFMTIGWGWSGPRAVGIWVWAPMFGLFCGGLAQVEPTERDDDSPLPVSVRRRVSVEDVSGTHHICVESRMYSRPWVLEIYQPWREVRQFVSTDYLRTFHGGQQVQFLVAWFAITMPPERGSHWLISSSIESETVQYERVTNLNAMFGDVARERAFRVASAVAGPAKSASDVPTSFE